MRRRRPPARTEHQEWDAAAIAQLRALHAEGLPMGEIGRRMGRPKGSIIGKAHRLGLAARPSPIRAPSAGPAAGKRVPDPTIVFKPAHKFTVPQVVRSLPPVLPAGVGTTEHQVAALGAMVRAILPPKPHQPGTGCRFPLWGDKERPTQLFCDKPRRMGPGGVPIGSYCAACHAVVFMTPARLEAERRLMGREVNYAMKRSRL